jgi:hypothetical protein
VEGREEVDEALRHGGSLMLYKKPRFTLPAVGDRKPTDCDHTAPWTDAKGRCVQCGERLMASPGTTVHLIQRAD